MATVVYIDGFNFYYGAVKGTPHKWLDHEALCRRLLPKDQIVKIRYFTARISARPDDPQQAVRQETYLRALATLPLIEIHYGHYVTRPTRMPLANPPAKGARTVEVLKTEEKGSDVNLATYLLLDAFQKRCDTAVVISNDSDLAEPVRIAQSEAGIKVGVINPHKAKYRSRRLQGTFFKQLRPSVLAQTQLPAVLHDAQGTIHKPALVAKTARARRSGPCTQPPKRLGEYHQSIGQHPGSIKFLPRAFQAKGPDRNGRAPLTSPHPLEAATAAIDRR